MTIFAIATSKDRIDMAKHTKEELAEIIKQNKALFELLLQKTGVKKKYIYDLAEQRFVVANLDVLTDAEKKQFTKLVFSGPTRPKRQKRGTKMELDEKSDNNDDNSVFSEETGECPPKRTDRAIITFEYDARNIGLKKLFDAALSLGAKKVDSEQESAHESALKALKEIRAGEGIRCKNMKEYKESLEKI